MPKSVLFVPCDLEIWQMTLKNNRAPLLCCLKFHSHQWILTGATVRKRPIWVKIDDYLSRIKLCASFHHNVKSNWSYSTETAKLGFDLCDCDFPTTSEWSTILLTTKVRLILEVLRYMAGQSGAGAWVQLYSNSNDTCQSLRILTDTW